MKISVNNIDFIFIKNSYGTHNWVAYDYNFDSEDEFEPGLYLGNLQVLNFIKYLMNKVTSSQRTVLESIFKLVNDSYIESVGKQFAYNNISYRESLRFSIGKRTCKYQLTQKTLENKNY